MGNMYTRIYNNEKRIEREEKQHQKAEAKQLKQAERADAKRNKLYRQEIHKQQQLRRQELLGELNHIKTEEINNKHILTTKEKQNELIKRILIIATIMLVTSLVGCIKTFISSGEDIIKIKDIISSLDIYIKSEPETLDKIVNTGGVIYQAFKVVKAIITHLMIIFINIITLLILTISRLFLIGKDRKIKYIISKVINITALIILINFVFLLFEINIADIATDLETMTLLTVYKLITKIIDAGLFIVEMWLIIKYTFLVVRTKRKEKELV